MRRVISLLLMAHQCWAALLNCSLNGEVADGRCHCDPGWKGLECEELDLRPISIEQHGYWNHSAPSWGGGMLVDRKGVPVRLEGAFHMFVSQFAGGCGLHAWEHNSYIARVSAPSLDEPFALSEPVVLPAEAHNPQALRLDNGTALIYVLHGCPTTLENCTSGVDTPMPYVYPECEPNIDMHVFASPDALRGPWTRHGVAVSLSNLPAGQSPPWWWCELHNGNPSPLVLDDGSVLLAVTTHCGKKGEFVLVARGTSPLGPFFVDAATGPVLSGELRDHSEDPHLYRNARGFHLLMHCMDVYCIEGGRHAFSEDGVRWQASVVPPYGPLQPREGLVPEYFVRRERPKLILDADGHPTHLVNAVLRAEDLPKLWSHTLVAPIAR